MLYIDTYIFSSNLNVTKFPKRTRVEMHGAEQPIVVQLWNYSAELMDGKYKLKCYNVLYLYMNYNLK